MTERQGARLRPLAVDLDGILDALTGEDPDVDWFIDLETGEVQMAIGGVERASLAPGVGPRRYEPLPAVDADQEHAIMLRFAREVGQDQLRAELEEALGSKGAFARFRAVLAKHRELQQAWSDARRRAYATIVTQWLESLGFSIDPEGTAVASVGRRPIRDTWPDASKARVGLMELLLLGAWDEPAAEADGRLRRSLSAVSDADARVVFENVAQDLCACHGVTLRVQQGSERFVLNGVELVRRGARVEIAVRVSADIRQVFSH